MTPTQLQFARRPSAGRAPVAADAANAHLRPISRAPQTGDRACRAALDAVGAIAYRVAIEPGGSAGRLDLFDGAVDRLLGSRPGDQSPGAVIPWESIMHPDDRDLVREGTSEIVRTGGGHRIYRLRHALSGQYRWFDDHASVHRDRSGEPIAIAGILRHISANREASTQSESETQARQALMMEALGRLAGGVAHDFNNVLTVVTGSVEMLLKGLPADGRLRKAALAIQGAAGRATSLTNQLLTFSRRQMLAPRVLDVNGLVSGMDALLRRLIGEDVELVISLGEPGRVKADPCQLEQVLMNLAANARDAMPNGGTLTIETFGEHIDTRPVSLVDSLTPGTYACVTVSDTGCGIDPSLHGRLFEPFFTTKARGKGTGLGLSSAHAIVEQSGGRLTVASRVGAGTTFAIRLPAVDSPVSEVGTEAAPVGVAGGRETILIVEDDDSVRSLLREHLETLGYSVLEARGGAEALIIAAWHAGQIHLLVTDLVMPQMNGREVADRLAMERPELKVLYVSGHTDHRLVSQGERSFATALLRKPFAGQELARRVRALLDVPPGSHVDVTGA